MGSDQDARRRCIFVTGAASGIGRATATFFAEKGWLVGAHDVDEAGLATLRAELGAAACLTRRLDVRDKPDFDRAVAEFGEATDGQMDILFNNAGICEGGWFEEIPYEATVRVLEVNLLGVVNGIYAALPLLKATEGSLCFTTSSSSATYGMPRLAAYAATKFAVKGLTEALSLEFERHGVRVADVLPGIIDTPILDVRLDSGAETTTGGRIRDTAMPDGALRMMSPGSVAECVWSAYGSTRLHWYVPEEIGKIDRMKAHDAESMRDMMRPGVPKA